MAKKIKNVALHKVSGIIKTNYGNNKNDRIWRKLQNFVKILNIQNYVEILRSLGGKKF